MMHTDTSEGISALEQCTGESAPAIDDNATSCREVDEAFTRLHHRHDVLLNAVGDGIFGLDRSGTITFVNPAAAGMLGYDAAELIGQPRHAAIHHTRQDDKPYPAHDCPIDATLNDGSVNRVADEVFWRRDGTSFPVEYVSTPIRPEGEVIGAVVTFRDVTERKRAEAALRHSASHDALTDLPNRAVLHDRLAQALHAAQRNGIPFSLLLLDLDRFKEINDTLGHHYGDLVLQQVAGRLRRALRAVDTVARLGGDEFAVLLPATHQAGATTAARKLLGAFRAPFLVERHFLNITPSIGIALYADHAADEQTLLRQADVAMYAAKRARKGFVVYAPEQDQHDPSRLALMNSLRDAIELRQLTIYYQPKVDMAEERVVGAEALVRWQHPELGLIPPDQFVPVAEHTGLIVPLTLYVLEEAVRQCADWHRAGLDMSVAVNLSMWSLHDPGLPDAIARLLRAHDLAPSYLRVELTESTIMADVPQQLGVLHRLRKLGLHISVDDFGTGYSSMTYLKRLPIDEIKIDKSFVQHMVTNEADAAIVSAIIGLGHSLGLQVVAEGVENEQIFNMLATLGCDVAQGYVVSGPRTGEQLRSWLRSASMLAVE